MQNLESDSPFLSQEDETIDFRQYLALLRQWWWVFILSTLVAGAAGWLFSNQMTPIYRASTTIMINEVPSSTKAIDLSSITTSERLAQTYASMMTKRPVLEKVMEELGIISSPEQIAKMISVTQVRNTQLLEIAVESPDPNFSASVANALISNFSNQLQDQQSSRYAATKISLEERIAEVEGQIAAIEEDLNTQKNELALKRQTLSSSEVSTLDSAVAELGRLESRIDQYESVRNNLILSYEQVRLAEVQSFSNVVQIEPAEAAERPIEPNIPQNTVLAAVVGLMLSLGGVFIYDFLDDTVKSPEEIKRRMNVTILGMISNFKEPEDGQLLMVAQPRSPVAESFRSLRTNIQFASVSVPVRTLLVTSTAPSDGKTTIASNLAMVSAHGGRNVTVVDADLHRPRVHSTFKLSQRPGLSNLFIQPEVYINGTAQATASERLKVISAGELPPNPSELLGSNRMREILNSILETSDLVIVDTPPVLALNDAVVLATVVDGVIIVVRPGVTKMSALKYAVDQLHYVGANIMGVVINRVNDRSSRYGYYYKDYHYKQHEYYSENGKRGKRKNTETPQAARVLPVNGGEKGSD